MPGRPRQEWCCKAEASLDYTDRFRPVQNTEGVAFFEKKMSKTEKENITIQYVIKGG